MLQRVWRKGSPPMLLVGMYTGASTAENSMEIPQKTKNRVAILSSNHTPRHKSRESSNLKRCMHPSVHNSTMYDSQNMEAS